MEGVQPRHCQLRPKWIIKDLTGMFNHSLEGKGLSDDRSPLRIEAAQQVGEALKISDAEAKRAIIRIFARRPPKQKAALSLYLQRSSFIEMAPPTVVQPAEHQIAYLLWKCNGEAMPLRVLATCLGRFPGRRRDTSGLLELALGVLDAFWRQMERAAHRPAPLSISAETSITVEQPELKGESGPSGSIAHGVTRQHPPFQRTRSTAHLISSKLGVIEVSADSGRKLLGGSNNRQVCSADSANVQENCGDNFSAERQAAGADLVDLGRFGPAIGQLKPTMMLELGVQLAARAEVINGTGRLGTLQRAEASMTEVDAFGITGQLDEAATADHALSQQAGQMHESQRKGGKKGRDNESGGRDQDGITAAAEREAVQIGRRDAERDLTDGVIAKPHHEPPAEAENEGPVVKRARRE